MKPYFVIIFFCYSIACSSQNKDEKALIESMAEKLKLNNSDEFNFSKNINNYEGSKFYRIWTNSQIIEVWISDSTEMFPNTKKILLNNWAMEEFMKIKPSESFFYKQQISFFSPISNEIFRIIDSLDIEKIPNYSEIDNWLKKDFDHQILVIEFKINGHYQLKVFPDYSLNHEIEYGKKINCLITKLEQIIQLKDNFDKFIFDIPVECYSNLELGTYCKVLTKRKLRAIKKRRNSYHQYRIANNKK